MNPYFDTGRKEDHRDSEIGCMRRHEDRMKAIEAKINAHIVESQLESMKFAKQIKLLVDALDKNSARSAELLHLYDNTKVVFSAIGWLKTPALWLTSIAAASLVVVAIWKYMVLEALGKGAIK